MRFHPRGGLLVIMALGFLAHCQCDTATLNNRKPAHLALDPQVLAFGDVPVTFTSAKAVTVRNDGELDLHVSAVSPAGDTSFIVGTAPTSIAGRASATFTVLFRPVTEGAQHGTLTLKSDAENGDQTVTLTGNGAAPFMCGDCNNPPAPQCLSPQESISYDSTGTCTDGQCRYTARRTACAVFCNAESGTCDDATDGGVPDAGRADAGTTADAGNNVDAGTCDVDGTYTVSGDSMVYTCCFGLVNIDINSLTLSSDGTQVTGSPNNPTLTGTGATCPSGAFSVHEVNSGGCTETYTLSGNFTSENTFSGNYTVTFSGNDCGCFGGLGTVCADQFFSFTATR